MSLMPSELWGSMCLGNQGVLALQVEVVRLESVLSVRPLTYQGTHHRLLAVAPIHEISDPPSEGEKLP